MAPPQREAFLVVSALSLPPLLLSCSVTLGTSLCSLGLSFLNSQGLGEVCTPGSLRALPHRPRSHCPDFSCSQNPTKRTSTRPRQVPSPL